MHTTSPSLLGRAAAGDDPAAWERLVALYTPLLLGWGRRLGLSDADAADFAQEVFAKLVEHLPAFRHQPGGSFRGWLKTVLVNLWRQQARTLARRPAVGGDPDQIADSDPAALVDEADHRDHLVKRALAVAEADFEPATWAACWQVVAVGRPAAEVAAELGLTVNAVYLAKSRVLRHLRAELAGLID